MNCRKCGAGPEHLEVGSDKGPEDEGPIELLVKCNKCGAQYTVEFYGKTAILHDRVKDVILDVLYEYFPSGENVRARQAAAEILAKLGENGVTIGFAFKEGM